MEENFISSFIKKNKPQFLKYKNHISVKDWSEASQKQSIKDKSMEFGIQNDLIMNIINRLKFFVNKAGNDIYKKEGKAFSKYCLDIIELHTERTEEYVNSIDPSKIESKEVLSAEIKFNAECFQQLAKISEEVDKLQIKDENVTDGIEFYSNQKATVAMHKDIVRYYPKVKDKLKLMKIDFDSPPPNTIHILNQNPPEYDADKNYWEQDKKTLQYYVDELKKIDYGVTIDGHYIDGWLYYHFNHFVTKVPTTVIKGGVKENEDVVKVPDLRDNELLITDYFIKSKREGLMSLIAATRRAAKTTMNASRIARGKILGKKHLLCAGGSAEDLGHISANIEICDENINPAFRLYYLAPTEDGRGKAYGIKTKDNKSKVISNTYIINLEGGTSKKKKETLAGFTPDEFILDEAMKFPFKYQLEALEPALWGAGVLRCAVILTGTGGSEELAKDAIKMLSAPKDYRISLMDWEDLERHVPKEEVTWKRKDFGLFLPTQMCVKHVKIKSNMADYLGVISETLSKIPVYVTDWKTAREKEEEERASKIGDKKSYVRLLAYHPFDPNEIFLSGNINPFPVSEAKAHREYLVSSGKWDRRRDVYKDSEGKIRCDISTKDLAEFPFNGSNIDAPFLIFEDFPTEKPKYGQYVAGFDDYKHDSAEQASLATFSVWKAPSLGDPFSNKLVASLSFRPDRHSTVHEKWLLLMEAYGLDGTCFGENEDFTIKDFLDRRHLTDKYLATSLDFSQSFNLPNNLKRKYGWTPQSCKRYLFNLFIDYCDDDFEFEDEDGKIISRKGVQRIDDIYLLDEIINYSENQNVDRIIAAMGGVGYLHYMVSSHRWKIKEIQRENREQENKRPVQRQKSFYNQPKRRAGFYRNR